MKTKLFSLLLLLAFNVISQDKEVLLAQYKAEVLKQASAYPINIDERNILRNIYIKGNTHTLEVQVIDRFQADIRAEEKGNIEKQLRNTLGVLYCKDGTNESIPRTLGLNVEYKYLDKDLKLFHSIVFSQDNCDHATATAKKIEEEVRTELQIKELNLAGTGQVTVCRDSRYNGSITVFYTNEIEKRAVVYAADEYVVNTVALSLNKIQITQFSEQLLSAEIKAKESPNLEYINLGEYKAQIGSVIFLGQKGFLRGYFKSNTSVDSVILSIDAKKINHCLDQIEPFL